VEGARATPLGTPALPRHLGGVGLAVDGAVELEHRIASEHEAIEAGFLAVRDGLGLGAREQLHDLRRVELAVAVPCAFEFGVLVDVGCDRDGLDAGAPQEREPGRGGGGEVEAHRPSVTVCDARRMTDGAAADGELVELDVTGVANGGVFVARHEGRVVFVSDAVDGERVLARVAERRATFWRADTMRVIEASPHRVEHVWDAAALARDPEDRAGGAEFGHIDLAHQRALKARLLADTFRRFAGIEVDATVERVEAARAGSAGWRTRVRLHVDPAGRVGPYAARSHRVVPVRELPLATAGAAAVAPLGGVEPGVRHVELVDPSVGEPLALVGEDAPAPVVREVVAGHEFSVEARGFWQVHVGAPETLWSAVQHALGGDVDPEAQHLDLYGGVGLLGAAVADRLGPGASVTSVESDRAASRHARDNLALWRRAVAVRERVDRHLSRLARDAPAATRDALRRGTVVLDPPRSGASGEVVRSLGSLAPERIVYVSCDPVTLARDAAGLAGHGYALAGLRAFDLFPHTHHLEALAVFLRE